VPNGMSGTAEALATLIEHARQARVPIVATDPEWQGLDRASADQVAQVLYERWGATGSPYWKLGAVDAETQSRLGLDGPVCAPLVPDRVVLSCDRLEIDSADFLHAKFEAEVGISVGSTLLPIACVEIADSSFTAWRLPSFGVIADGCLQSMMLFGPPTSPQDTVQVEVSHNGLVVASGTQDWAGAAARLNVLPANTGATHVATGSMTPLLDVTAGEWLFDFGSLGKITVLVR